MPRMLIWGLWYVSLKGDKIAYSLRFVNGVGWVWCYDSVLGTWEVSAMNYGH